MGKITKLEVQKNNKQKVNLYLDGEFYSRLYLDTCVKYGLKNGLEIDEDSLKKIIYDSEKNLAVNFALNYVGSALKTKKQIKDYLKKKEFDEDIIKYVLDKLEEYKYIDDEQYISSYVATYSNKYGITKLKNNLKNKGVSQKIIDNFFEDNIEDFIETQKDVCLKFARKKAKGMDLNDIKNIQKISRHLVSKGFDFDEINHSLNILKKEIR